MPDDLALSTAVIYRSVSFAADEQWLSGFAGGLEVIALRCSVAVVVAWLLSPAAILPPNVAPLEGIAVGRR